ncbi:BTAD domain-containing putative transcriptional regulator [Kitasatospora sp. NPDC001527]|uniref:AfsR/SARP family transcriptional regulator n=1 Tax=Kitasatospora sp. NPDC001527 TaxID=3154519 RepID=UPI00332B3F56
MLGPVRIIVDGTDVTPTGTRARTLLAALMSEPGTPVPTSRLIGDLWGSRPPRDAPGQLMSHVSRLRRRLAEAGDAAPAVVHRHKAYLLAIEAGQLDADLFTDLVGRGRSELAHGRATEAHRLLVRALVLWRGDAFTGVPLHGRLGEQKRHLQQAHTAALALRVEAEQELRPFPDLTHLNAPFTATSKSRSSRTPATSPAPRAADRPETPRRAGADDQQPVIRLLGRPRIRREAEEVRAGSPGQAAVLAMLADRPGAPVATDELIDGLWGEQPPGSAMAIIRNYVSRLRPLLRHARTPGIADILVHHAGAYTLHVAPKAVDVPLVTTRAREASAALSAGDPARARELAAAGLALWTGRALVGVPGPFADQRRLALHEELTRLQVLHAEAGIDLGLVEDAVASLTTLSAEHPLHEAVAALLMRALFLAGRRDDALAHHAFTARILGEELGVDPGDALTSIRDRITAAASEPRPSSRKRRQLDSRP